MDEVDQAGRSRVEGAGGGPRLDREEEDGERGGAEMDVPSLPVHRPPVRVGVAEVESKEGSNEE